MKYRAVQLQNKEHAELEELLFACTKVAYETSTEPVVFLYQNEHNKYMLLKLIILSFSKPAVPTLLSIFYESLSIIAVEQPLNICTHYDDKLE